MNEDRLRAITDVNNQSFYNLLGVDVGAAENALRKAYKMTALRNHPDKGGDADTFKRIQKAYEVLVGPLREVYDECGEEGLELLQLTEPQVRNSMHRDHVCCLHCSCLGYVLLISMMFFGGRCSCIYVCIVPALRIGILRWN